MSLKYVDPDGLRAWVDGMVGKGTVIGVQAQGDRYVFGPLAKAADLRLDYDVTILPPKKYFQPQAETLLTYDGQGYHAAGEVEPFILMGVHPYDVAAIAQMDVVFREGQPDVHYQARRDAATIVAVDVESVSANVFAGWMGTASVREGYDVLLTRVGEGYVVEAATPKGEALVASMAGARDAGGEEEAGRQAVWEANEAKLRRHELKAAPETWSELAEKGYDHPVWEEKAAKCFSCGSCNLPCPTCYCFDVREDPDWDVAQGRRERVWDGCMLRDFATVAGGHNFRKNRADRYRHRYYRKAKYVPERMGTGIACVGCGRCITACVAGIANPVEVFNRLQEEA